MREDSVESCHHSGQELAAWCVASRSTMTGLPQLNEAYRPGLAGERKAGDVSALGLIRHKRRG